MGRKATVIVSIILFVVSIISVLLVGFYFNLFNSPNKTYVALMIIIPLVQLSVVLVARFKK